MATPHRRFDRHTTLTPRETDILSGLLVGDRAIEVGAELGIAETTLRSYMRGLHKKTQTTNLHGLVLWAHGHDDCCLSGLFALMRYDGLLRPNPSELT